MDHGDLLVLMLAGAAFTAAAVSLFGAVGLLGALAASAVTAVAYRRTHGQL